MKNKLKIISANTEYEAINTGHCFSFSSFSKKKINNILNLYIIKTLIQFCFISADSGNKKPFFSFGSNNDDEEQGQGLTSIHQISG